MKKKLSLLMVALIAVAAFAVQQARRTGSESSYTIVFKEWVGHTDGDNTSQVSSLEDLIADGADYVESFTKSNVYQAREGRGIKLGTSSKTGYLTLKLNTPIKPTKVVVSARGYSDSEKTLKLFDTEFDNLTTEFADYTVTFDGQTEISQITFGTTAKRSYVKSVTVYYEGGETPAVTVATPSITGTTPFVGSTEVTIATETEGAKIYYTTDGTDPTTGSTEYTAAFSITETTTVKAIAAKDGASSAVASKEFTAIPSVATVAELNALADKAAFAFTGNAIVVAKPKSGSKVYTYIKDNTGASLIYDVDGSKTQDLGIGVTIAANWTGKVSIYKKLFEAVPDAALTTNGLSVVQVTYDEIELADVVEANVNKVVTLKGVTYTLGEGKNISITKEGNEMVVAGYNQFGLEIADPEDGKTYDMIGAIGRYNDNIQFQPIEIKEHVNDGPQDITIAPESGDISTALATATEGKQVKDITINLAQGGAYTVSAPIVAPGSVTINGNGATIDAANFAGDAIVKMAASAEAPTEITKVDGISFKDMTVKGLKKALFYSTQKKYDIAAFTIDNCVIELAADVITIDFTKGSAARVINVTKSTIYAPTATTKSFYSSQSGEKVTELDANATQTFAFNNNTIYNLAKGKNFFTHRQNSQKWLAYTATNNIFVNVGKSGQVMRGMNGGGQSTNPTWIADGNAFNFDGADTSGNEHPSASSDDVVKNSVAGVMAFTSTETPDFGGTFELAEGATAPSALGDPRWSITFKNPDTYVVAGNLAAIFGTAWDATNEYNKMTKNADGTYSMSYTVEQAYSGVQLKVVKNGSEWYGDANGNNVTFNLTGAGEFTVTYNPTTNEVTVTGDNVQSVTFEYTDVYAVGNGSGNWLNGKLWDQAAAENKMTKVSDGVFEITYQNVPAGGPYQVKFAFDGSWTYNFGGTFSAFNEATDAVWDGDNITFGLAEASDVTVRLDLTGFDFSTKQGAKFTITGGEDSYVVAGAVGEKDSGAKDFMFGTAWDATAEANKLTKNEETGLYEKTYEGVAFEEAATISYKIVKNGSTWIPDGDNQTCAITEPGTYNIVVTFNPETKEATMTATAAGPQYVDVNVDMDSSMSITQGLNAILQGKPAGNVNILLKGEYQYTIEAPIEAAGKVTINGRGAKIDASALTGDAFIVLNGTTELAKNADGTDSDHKHVSSVVVENATITGLTTAFVKDAQKTLLDELTVDNSIIEMPASNKNFIDFNSKGYVGNVKVSKSTIWAKDKNTGFFAQYGSRPKNVDGSLLQQFDVQNSTIVNIANGKNFCDLKQNGTAQNVYTIKNNIFTDCGKSGQTVVGFNKGQPSATPVWDVDGNTFMFGGASTNAAEVEKAGQKDGEDIVQNCVEGDPEFKDAANGDFTVGEHAQQQLTRTGDPRWLAIYVPEGVTAPIELTPQDGADLAMDLAEAYLEQGLAPAYITINLLPGAHYTVSQPMEINATINIIGDEANPATIDLNDCSGPMVQYSSTIAPAFTVNNYGFYEEPFNVIFKNVIFARAKNQLFYANKQKYLVEYFTFENCIAEYLGGSKTIFDFSGGGVVDNFTINNSTIYGNSNDGMKHTGALYSSQSGDKATAAGLTEQKFNITNSTLYNIANGKNVMNHRQTGQTWLTFTVKNNVVFNCGKKGQFCQGLNGGQDSENPMFYVHYNSFMWYADGVLADIDDTCGSKNPNVVTASWKNTYPESAITDVFPKFFHKDEIGQYIDSFRGNFTVAEGSVQKTNSVGDPRWLKSNNEYTDIQGVNADKLTEGEWYTIQGVRVDQPTKGLYIHNGRKVVLK